MKRASQLLTMCTASIYLSITPKQLFPQWNIVLQTAVRKAITNANATNLDLMVLHIFGYNFARVQYSIFLYPIPCKCLGPKLLSGCSGGGEVLSKFKTIRAPEKSKHHF